MSEMSHGFVTQVIFLFSTGNDSVIHENKGGAEMNTEFVLFF